MLITFEDFEIFQLPIYTLLKVIKQDSIIVEFIRLVRIKNLKGVGVETLTFVFFQKNLNSSVSLLVQTPSVR